MPRDRAAARRARTVSGRSQNLLHHSVAIQRVAGEAARGSPPCLRVGRPWRKHDELGPPSERRSNGPAEDDSSRRVRKPRSCLLGLKSLQAAVAGTLERVDLNVNATLLLVGKGCGGQVVEQVAQMP